MYMIDIKRALNLNSILSVIALAAVASTGQAGPVGPLTTFTAGTPAKASDVNANFTTIVNTVNANDTRLTTVETNKQNVITGNCPAGSAIRAVAPNGTVTCQNSGGTVGFVSVAGITGVPQFSNTPTSVCDFVCQFVRSFFGGLPSAFGRYQSATGNTDVLLVPINLPHGATVTAFSFTCFRNTATNCGASLSRDDGNLIASITTVAQATTPQTASASSINTSPAGIALVNNTSFSYFVSMTIDGTAGADLVPIRATVTYTTP
jgi:hypothetical protein